MRWCAGVVVDNGRWLGDKDIDNRTEYTLTEPLNCPAKPDHRVKRVADAVNEALATWYGGGVDVPWLRKLQRLVFLATGIVFLHWGLGSSLEDSSVVAVGATVCGVLFLLPGLPLLKSVFHRLKRLAERSEGVNSAE